MRPLQWMITWGIALFSFSAHAQVAVTATSGLPAAGYTTLKGAFDAINNGVHQGQISILLNGSTTETATATLNGSGGLSSYSSVAISPAATCTISGSMAGPLLLFNGADLVTIDGRIGGTGTTRSLTIQNIYGNPAGFPPYTLRFMNGANSNKVRYCILEGLGHPSQANAVVDFMGANSGNKVDNNEIRPVGNDWILRGTSGGDSVVNNLIHDFAGASSSAVGILNAGYAAGNSLYHTDTVTGAVQFAQYYISGGNVIRGNFIGGSAPGASGSPAVFSGNFTVTGISAAGTIDSNVITNICVLPLTSGGFTGIRLNGSIGFCAGNRIGSLTDTNAVTVLPGSLSGIFAGNTSPSSNSLIVQGNSIGGLTATTAITGIGIYSTDTVTLKDNIIGGTTPGNIRLQSAATGEFRGISIEAADNERVRCSNNIIRNATGTGNVWMSGIYNQSQAGESSRRWLLDNEIYQLMAAHALGDVTVNGIYSGFSGGTGMRVNNIIRANHIHDLSIPQGGGGSAVTGIRNESLSKNYLIIDSNLVTGLSSAAPNPATVLAVAVQGIGIFNPSNAPFTISRNVIDGLSGSAAAATCVTGINAQYNSDSNQMVITGNKVTGLSNDLVIGGSVSGVMVSGATGGTFLVKNNMISLSPNSTGVYGIVNNLGASAVKIANNSIYISGTASGNHASAAFHRVFYAATPVHLQNNIFENFRTGGTGGHYCIMNAGSNPGLGWAYSNYNSLYSSNPNSCVSWGGSALSLAGYQSASAQDGCSLSDTADFVSPFTGDLHLLNTPHNQVFAGLGTPGVTEDFDGDPRNPFPAMGADELQFAYQGVSITGSGPFCYGSSGTLTASAGTGIQWYRNGVAISGATTSTLVVTQAGSYYVVLPNGCLTDTSNTITVGVKTINDTVVRTGFTIYSLQSGASYAWYDCDSNFYIPGATGQSFTAVRDGRYAVIIHYSGCVDTSACVSINGLTSVRSPAALSAVAFPNPGRDRVTISIDTRLSGGAIRVIDFLGRPVRRLDNLTGERFELDMNGCSAGVYFIEIKDNTRSHRVKWMKTE